MRYLMLVLLLAGCTRQEIAIHRMEQAVEVRGPACEKLGYKRDTDPWRDCVRGK